MPAKTLFKGLFKDNSDMDEGTSTEDPEPELELDLSGLNVDPRP